MYPCVTLSGLNRVLGVVLGASLSPARAADLDQFPDVVVTDLDSLWVFSGDGSGSSSEPRQLFIGPEVEPWHLVTGDLTGDGVVDIVSANRFGPHVTIHVGTGDGGFLDPLFLPTNPRAYDVDLGDFDGNGWLDIVVTCNNSEGPVEVHFNTGEGTVATVSGMFAEPVFLTPTSGDRGPFNSEVGDYNGDGVADLVVVNNESENVTILLNDGFGFLTPHAWFAAGEDPKAIKSGFINEDVHLDLVLTNYDAGEIGIFLGDGDGGFGFLDTYPAGVLPREIVLPDLNGDGVTDVVVAGGRGTDFIVRYLGKGDGTLASSAIVETGPRPNSVDGSDFNLDGHDDVIAANWSLGDESLSSMSLLLGDGAGNLGPAVNYEPGVGFRKITALAVGQFNQPLFLRGDANGDGAVNISDAITIVLVAIQSHPVDCLDASDADDSGRVDLTDDLMLFHYLFLTGGGPAAPFPGAGGDPTIDSLSCETGS